MMSRFFLISTLIPIVVILVPCLLITPPAFAYSTNTTCRPLLLMIEGGGGNNAGKGMQDLVNKIRPGAHSAGIYVDAPDNDEFWRFMTLQEDFLAAKIDSLLRGKYNPIVIVGHSMGGLVAYRLADSLPNTSLVVTLDPVSFWGSKDNNLPKPRYARRWIHIELRDNYRFLRIFGVPDWVGPRFNADKNLNLDMSHFDVYGMWNFVKEDVVKGLKCRRRIYEWERRGR